MLGTMDARSKSANKPAPASDTTIGVGCDSDAENTDWFGSIARQLLGKDAGFALSVITQVPEGSCYKYVTKKADSRRAPPGWLLRQILRSEQGGTFLAAFMDGADPAWWREHKRARRIADAVHDIDREFT